MVTRRLALVVAAGWMLSVGVIVTKCLPGLNVLSQAVSATAMVLLLALVVALGKTRSERAHLASWR